MGAAITFFVWPFYAALATMVVVLGQTVLLPSGKPQVLPQNPSINRGPFQPNTPRPDYTIQQAPSALPPGAVLPGNSKMPQQGSFVPPNGAQPFQPPSNQVTVSRPNIPPMGVPNARPNATGAATTSPAGPSRPPPMPAGMNRPMVKPSAAQPLKPQ